MNVLKSKLRSKKGFSLVEMAIALIVLSTLAGVVYLAAQPAVNRGSYTAIGQQLESLRGAITSFYGDNRKHPCKTGCTAGGLWTDLLPYIPTAPNSNWSATCTNGINLDVTVVASDLVSQTVTEFQKQCQTVVSDNTAKTVTCRLTTTAYCP